MDYILSDNPKQVKDNKGNIFIPKQLLETDSRLTCIKLWIQLAEMLEEGETTVIFDDTFHLNEELGFSGRRSLYPTLRKLEKLGWIRWEKGKNLAYKGIAIEVIADNDPTTKPNETV